MTARERAAVGLVVSAVGLGILGDLLFNGRPLGLNAVLFAVVVRARAGRDPARRPHPAAPGTAADGGAAARVRGRCSRGTPRRCCSPRTCCAIAGAVTLGALRRTRRPVAQAEVSDYVAGAASAGAAAFVGAVKLIEQDVPWRAVRERVAEARERRGDRPRARARPAAARALRRALRRRRRRVPQPALRRRARLGSAVWSHVALACVIGWAGAGLLRDLLATREDERVLGGTIDGDRPAPRAARADGARGRPRPSSTRSSSPSSSSSCATSSAAATWSSRACT